MKIDIHQLEALANELCESAADRRNHLARMIRAYARIINAKSPDEFPRMPLEYSDEDGHWDNSYPPEQEYKEYRGPRLYEVIDNVRESKATSGGFYHDSEEYTEDRGLYVSAGGEFYGRDEHGSSSYGQYAAHPGTDNVQIQCEYDEIDLDDIPLDRLEKAEKELRGIAFPLVAQRIEQLEEAAK